MAKQAIGIGSSANDGTGDPLRTAFDKINDNFTELYGTTMTERVVLDLTPQLGGDLDVSTFDIISASNRNIDIDPNGSGTIELKANTNVTGTFSASAAATLSTSLALATGATVTGIDNGSLGTSATLLATQGAIKTYVDAQVTASDLDFQGDSGGALAIDLDSEVLDIAGGTGLDTVGASNTLTINIDATVATLVGSQVLTNKTLTSPVLNTGVSGTAILDEDAMGTDSATQLATQQSIKAYVDGQNHTALTGSTNDQITTVTGANAIQGEANLTFNGTTLTVSGHGLVTGDLEVQGSINADMFISNSDGDIEINPAGTGAIKLTGPITATGTQTTTGQLNVDNLRLDGNTLSATSGGITLNPAVNQNIQLGGLTTVTEIHATTAEITTVRCDALQNDTSNGNITITAQGTGIVDISPQVTLTGSFKQAIHTFVATDAITETEHAGRTLLLGEVGGNALVTLTLPDATGSGATYKFIVTVANTSNYVIVCPDASNTISGIMMFLDEDEGGARAYPTVAASDTITLNGGTTGGLVGDYLELVDIATDKWHVRGVMRVSAGTNTATPFSATV